MATKRKTAAVKRGAAASARSGGGIAEWFSSPAVRYVAGGIATAMLAKIATNLAERYPQISDFLRDGLDTVEEKLSEFNGGSEMSMHSSAAAGSRSRRSSKSELSTH